MTPDEKLRASDAAWREAAEVVSNLSGLPLVDAVAARLRERDEKLESEQEAYETTIAYMRDAYRKRLNALEALVSECPLCSNLDAAQDRDAKR